jgi:hypothetical protein
MKIERGFVFQSDKITVEAVPGDSSRDHPPTGYVRVTPTSFGQHGRTSIKLSPDELSDLVKILDALTVSGK